MPHKPYKPYKFLILALLLLTACDKAENEYTSQVCFLVIDNSVHQDPTLAAAMTPHSNVFVTITTVNKSRAKYFHFQSSQGGTPTESIFNALDNRRALTVGMNNGLIVGFNVLDNVFYAFDRECPNCFSYYAIPMKSYPLTIGTDNIATCNACSRRYNLNNGGRCEGNGQKLTRYIAQTPASPYGTLSVR